MLPLLLCTANCAYEEKANFEQICWWQQFFFLVFFSFLLFIHIPVPLIHRHRNVENRHCCLKLMTMMTLMVLEPRNELKFLCKVTRLYLKNIQRKVTQNKHNILITSRGRSQVPSQSIARTHISTWWRRVTECCKVLFFPLLRKLSIYLLRQRKRQFVSHFQWVVRATSKLQN